MSHPLPHRGPIHPAIDEQLVGAMVDTFYGRIRLDPVLGPIFDGVIGDRWTPHLARMKDFWSTITMMSARYKGTPLVAHQRIGGLTAEHFERWLDLWRATAADVCREPEVADLFVERAERIAASLLYGMSAMPAPPARRTQGDRDAG
ncbi:MAG: group III truncated hemoglobin [Bauldia sp.]|nr:group III truncated hemoglobin [Bauldia sp.]